MISKVNLSEKFAQFDDTWSPKVVGELNEAYVKVAKLEGEFVWHRHDREDELFLVMAGHLTIRIADQPDVELDPGEFVIIPRGVEHMPVTDGVVHVVLMEPKTTVNTGNVVNDRTVPTDQWL